MLVHRQMHDTSYADLRAILEADGCMPRGKRFDCRHCEAERGRGHGRMAIAIMPVNAEHRDPIAFCHGCRRTWKVNVKRSKAEMEQIRRNIERRQEIRNLARRERVRGLKELYQLRKLDHKADLEGPTARAWNILEFTIRREFEVERHLDYIEQLEQKLLGEGRS